VSTSSLTSVLFVLLLLIGLAQLLGALFARMHQPKVIGEILAGVVLGPALLGRIPAVAGLTQAALHKSDVIEFIYWLGLLLLMFLSGAETQQLFTREERREVGWLTLVGTGLPFALGLVCAPALIRPALEGPNGNRLSMIIILAVGVAVTSVPVVSKIFSDLKILHTRFARLVLGVAVLEDIVLWLALAMATAAAGKQALDARKMTMHLAVTVAFFALGLTVVPRIVKMINRSEFNFLARSSPVGYAIAVLLTYCAIAGALDVSLVFAAFLAGFAVVHKKRRLFAEALESIGQVAFAVFVPVYFAIGGLKLDLARRVGNDCGVHSGYLRSEDWLGLAGWTYCRVPRTGPAEPGNHDQRARRTGNCAGQCGLRCRYYQLQVLHNIGGSCYRHLTDCRRVARFCAAQGVAIAKSHEQHIEP
jgi:Kef-type K+ transport system membrane component KefB